MLHRSPPHRTTARSGEILAASCSCDPSGPESGSLGVIGQRHTVIAVIAVVGRGCFSATGINRCSSVTLDAGETTPSNLFARSDKSQQHDAARIALRCRMRDEEAPHRVCTYRWLGNLELKLDPMELLHLFVRNDLPLLVAHVVATSTAQCGQPQAGS